MFSGIDLNLIWFILIAVLLTGYTILDGFDLGVGALHRFTRKDKHRRITLNSIGPVWDGNEVWLITGGGALFAAFPHVYATVFSGFYIAFMLLLFVIIFRAVSIEFRGKVESDGWRNLWDFMFQISSFVIPLLMGVAIGNIINGLPVGADMEMHISLFGLLTPYPLVIGLFTVAFVLMHGATYLLIKTEGELQEQVKGWHNRTYIIFVIFYIIATILTLVMQPHMLENLKDAPIWFVLPVLNIITIIMVKISAGKGKYFASFIYSSLTIAILFTLFAVGIFPDLVPSNIDPAYSLNMHNAASSQQTLGNMFLIALIGMPIVIGYTIFIYYTFRGKVKLDSSSY